MVVKIADNILSPLGMNTAENLAAVREGRSALRHHSCWQLPQPFMASLFAEGQLKERTYESAVCQSVTEALSQVPELDVSSPGVLLILSSSKGDTVAGNKTRLGVSAQNIARYLGISTRPLTISNACVSGISAQLMAKGMIDMGSYDTVIVAGCDLLNRFIVSGFQSFHSLSDDECRPFDEDRYGLNLGEAAATIIYQRRESANDSDWILAKGYTRNDAYHISAPSKTAEGSFKSLYQVMEGESAERLACISAHGTATLFNDEMESKSISRAGLSDILVNGLKGYFGHTLGAAGILETVVMMHSIDEGWIPGTRGFSKIGTSCNLWVSPEHLPTDKRQFVKMMSGFGGCNAAALFRKGDEV